MSPPQAPAVARFQMQTSITIKSYQEVMLPVSSFKVVCRFWEIQENYIFCLLIVFTKNEAPQLHSEIVTGNCFWSRNLPQLVHKVLHQLRHYTWPFFKGLDPAFSANTLSEGQFQTRSLLNLLDDSYYWSSLKATKTNHGQWDWPDICTFHSLQVKISLNYILSKSK